MPLRSYGVLTARVVDRRREDQDDSPHFQIELADERGTRYRAAVNVKNIVSVAATVLRLFWRLRGLGALRRSVRAVERRSGGWESVATKPAVEELGLRSAAPAMRAYNEPHGLPLKPSRPLKIDGTANVCQSKGPAYKVG